MWMHEQTRFPLPLLAPSVDVDTPLISCLHMSAPALSMKITAKKCTLRELLWLKLCITAKADILDNDKQES